MSAHRSAAPLALAVAALGCSMPELPDGYQLQCETFHDECPAGTNCIDNCCVRPGEKPICQSLSGFGGSAVYGRACSQGTCPSGNFDCLDQRSTGIPGGMCSFTCTGTCPGAACRKLLCQGPTCASYCTAICSDLLPCRPGFRCDCSSLPCACLPDCRLEPGICGFGPGDASGNRCDGLNGFCFDCATNDDCNGRSCCRNHCSDTPC